MTQVAFIGLGAMGYRMASHLPARFDDVLVWNRTFSKAEHHTSQYGTRAVDISIATQADIVMSCLPTSAEVESIIRQHPPRKGGIWIDCTSGEPQSARRMTEWLATHGAHFLDAPVSGQTIGAERGTLTVMVGGDAEILAQALPVLQCVGQLIQHVGQSGSGFAVKAVNNFMLAANLLAAAEGLSILRAQGVDLENALTCINASSGKSTASDTIIPQRVLNRSFPNTFALSLLLKDVGIASYLGQAAQLTPLPLTQQVYQLLMQAQQMEPQSRDFSTAVKLYEQWHGQLLGHAIAQS